MNQPLSHTQPNLDNIEAWLVKFALNREETENSYPTTQYEREFIFNTLVDQMQSVCKLLCELVEDSGRPIMMPESRGVKLDNCRRQMKQAYVCLFGLVVGNCGNDFDEGMARMRGAWSCVPHLNSDTAVREWRLAMAYLLEGNPAYTNKFMDALYAAQREHRELTVYTDVQAVDGEDAVQLRQRTFGTQSAALSITALPTGEATEL